MSLRPHQHLFLVRDLEARCGFRLVARTDADRSTAAIRWHQRCQLDRELEIVPGGPSSCRRVVAGGWVVLVAHSASGLDRCDSAACRTDPCVGTAGIGTSAGRVVVERGVYRTRLAAVRSEIVRSPAFRRRIATNCVPPECGTANSSHRLCLHLADDQVLEVVRSLAGLERLFSTIRACQRDIH